MRLRNRSQTCVEALDLGVGPLADLVHLALGGLADLALGVGLGALGLELGEVLLEALLAGLDVGVAAGLDLLALDADLGLERRQVAVALVLVDRGDHVGREVDDLLEVLRRQVEQVAQPAGHALEVPDVRDRGGQLDVAHPLTAHLGAGDLDAAALADDALEADPLVLAAVALPVAGRTEDLLAEEPVLLRLQGAVVDGLRLLDLAVGPLTDVVSGGQADAQLVEEVDVEHVCFSLSLVINAWSADAVRRRAAWRLVVPHRPRPLRRCSARAGTGRCRAPRPHGRRPRRSRASRWTCRRWTAPRR